MWLLPVMQEMPLQAKFALAQQARWATWCLNDVNTAAPKCIFEIYQAPPVYDFVKEKTAHLSFASCPSLITFYFLQTQTQVHQTPKWNWPKTTPTDFETVKLPFELCVYIFTNNLHLLQNNRKNMTIWITLDSGALYPGHWHHLVEAHCNFINCI